MLLTIEIFPQKTNLLYKKGHICAYGIVLDSINTLNFVFALTYNFMRLDRFRAITDIANDTNDKYKVGKEI